MLNAKAKRFYADVRLRAGKGGTGVRLDNRDLKTPAGGLLVLPSARLAEACAGEWRSQGDEVRPSSMPLTQLAFTALDRVGPRRDEVAQDIAKYGASDLICYRADNPDDLAAEQAARWDPLIAWVERDLGVRLRTTAGILHVEQPRETAAAFENRLAGMSGWRLTAAASVTQATGSLVIALALDAGELDGESAFAASIIDEAHQSRLWGVDAEARKRLDGIKQEVETAARFLHMLRA